jgi:lysophospholipase L1-like esterase
MAVPGVAGDGYRNGLREIARSEGATLVEDFLEGVVPVHTYDRLHPNEQGQAMLAVRLQPVVRKALGR